METARLRKARHHLERARTVPASARRCFLGIVALMAVGLLAQVVILIALAPEAIPFMPGMGGIATNFMVLILFAYIHWSNGLMRDAGELLHQAEKRLARTEPPALLVTRGDVR